MEKKKRKNVDFNEEQIKLAIDIYNKIRDEVDFLLYLHETKEAKLSFILIETTIGKFSEYINKAKRSTDIFFEVNKEKGIYLVVCQETDVYGGYQFLERLFTPFKNMNNVCTCASLLSIQEHKSYTAKQVIFKMLDNFISLIVQPNEWKKCQISYKSL